MERKLAYPHSLGKQPRNAADNNICCMYDMLSLDNGINMFALASVQSGLNV